MHLMFQSTSNNQLQDIQRSKIQDAMNKFQICTKFWSQKLTVKSTEMQVSLHIADMVPKQK